MKYLGRFWIYAVLIIGIPNVIAQESCSAFLDTILNNVDSACARVDADTACYGSGSVDLMSRSDETSLLNSGDSLALDTIESIQVSGDNETDYGLLVMALQANNPSETALTTVYALGDVSITNNIPVFTRVSVTTSANARTRRIPQVDENPANIITSIPQGVILSAIGRTEDGTWMYVDLDRFADKGATEGWISTQVLSINGDQTILPVVDLDNPIEIISPMSSLALDTEIGSSDCEGLPPSGIVVQSSNGDTSTLTINGALIQVVGTAFLDTEADMLNIHVIEGRSVIITDETPEFVPAGTKSVVTLNEDNQTIAASPIPYDAEYLAPLDSLLTGDMMAQSTSSGLIQVAEIADPLPQDEIEVTVQESFAPFGGVDGVYAAQQVMSDGEVFNNLVYITFAEDTVTFSAVGGGNPETYTRTGNTFSNSWTLTYDSAIMEDGTQLQTTSVANFTYTITSPTTISMSQAGTITRPVYSGEYATGVETVPTSSTASYVWVSF